LAALRFEVCEGPDGIGILMGACRDAVGLQHGNVNAVHEFDPQALKPDGFRVRLRTRAAFEA
jgi:hypothetical protein